MNTEKIEKLKKGLTNSQIPESLREKIREQIKKMEAEDLKESAPKVVNVAPEEKEKSTPAPKVEKAKVTRTPRVKKVVEHKESTTKKPTAMALAKEIRKDGESWKEAVKRASSEMKKGTTETKKAVVETKKATITEMQKLLKFVKRRKELKNISGTNLQRDASRSAKPSGKRTSKEGNVYYENRENRTDRLAPNYPKGAPKLANGGMMNNMSVHEGTDFMNTPVYKKGGGIKNKLESGVYRIGKPIKVRANLYEQKIVEIFDNGNIATASDYGRSLNDFKSQKYPIISKEQFDAQYNYADGGDFMNTPVYAGGGGVGQVEHFPLDKEKLNEDAKWYADRIKSGKMSTTKKSLTDDIEEYKKDLFLLEVGRKKPSNIIGTGYKGNTKKMANTWLLNEIYKNNKILELLGDNYSDGGFMDGVYAEEGAEVTYTRNKDGIRVKSVAMPEERLTEAEWLAKHNESREARTYAVGGGIFADTFSGYTGTHYTGLVGETNAMSSGEMFMAGGRVRRTKAQMTKDRENKEIDAYNWYVVDLEENKAITGNEYREDAVDALSDYDGDKRYKVVSKKTLKSLGIENPNERFKSYEVGGGVGDLFQNYDEQPEELAEITNFYAQKFDEDDYDYEDSKNFLKAVEAIGYTFDYGLDNEPYGLRPIGTTLDEYEVGGGVGDKKYHMIIQQEDNYIYIKMYDKSDDRKEYGNKLQELLMDITNYGDVDVVVYETTNEIDTKEKFEKYFKNLQKELNEYAKGGGVRTQNGREYSLGRNWTNDHRHENKHEDYEVPMYKRK